jgi:hypothetical protein
MLPGQMQATPLQVEMKNAAEERPINVKKPRLDTGLG